MNFEWDATKASANRRKHGVPFEEAQEVFGDPCAMSGDDTGHSEFEDRERTVGRSSKRRILVVISSRRAGVTRIISARKATGDEAKAYEKAVEEKLRGRR